MANTIFVIFLMLMAVFFAILAGSVLGSGGNKAGNCLFYIIVSIVCFCGGAFLMYEMRANTSIPPDRVLTVLRTDDIYKTLSSVKVNEEGIELVKKYSLARLR